jgi:predicted nucleic acid-binding protein
VAGYFLDTSALAKLYHEEPGSRYVERILIQPGSKVIISRLSLVEMESVLAIKVRVGALNLEGRAIALRRLRADIARERLVVGPPLEEKHYRSAVALLREHGITRGLRTLDALQLAIGLDLHDSEAVSLMICADHRLCSAAEACGCPALDPANPGPVFV